VRRLPFFEQGTQSAVAALGVLFVTVILSFAVTMVLRRTPFLRRLV